MKSHSYPQLRLIQTLLLVVIGAVHAEMGTDSLPRLKVAALLNLDLGGVPPSDLSTDDLPVDLTHAELGLGLHPRPDIGLDAVLVHQDGQAVFEQAFATWTSPAGTLAFGKQTLPVGLYAGRLIHDPLLQQDLEIIAPSVLACHGHGPLAFHLALASEPHFLDSGTTSNHPTAVAAIDFTRCETAKIRLSGKCAHHLRLIDLGAEIGWEAFLLDLEGLVAEGAWAGADLGTLAGVSWKASPTTTLSTRLDTRKPHGIGVWSRSIAAGAFQRFAEVAYVGAEWLQDLDAGGVLTLRWGLEVELFRP